MLLLKNKTGLFLMAISISCGSFASEMGSLTIGGTGCTVPNGSHELVAVEGEASRYGIPLQLSVFKESTAAFARASCQFALPIQVHAGEKVLIMDASQNVRLSVGKSTQARSSLSVFAVGQAQQTPVGAQVSGVNGRKKLYKEVELDGLIAESACGQDIMVRGNTNILVQGSGQSTSSTGALLLTIKTVACN